MNTHDTLCLTLRNFVSLCELAAVRTVHRKQNIVCAFSAPVQYLESRFVHALWS